MDGQIRIILSELKSRLSVLYGPRLQGVYLFGSYARGEADDESDVDILIVLDRVDDYSAEINRSSEVISDISLKYGITLSRVFVSAKQWRDDLTLFFLNVREEAIPA
ncbi:MAG: nucleotidyltransferase domain-containing protein [Candidatus Glassbacteria bacterium]